MYGKLGLIKFFCSLHIGQDHVRMCILHNANTYVPLPNLASTNLGGTPTIFTFSILYACEISGSQKTKRGRRVTEQTN